MLYTLHSHLFPPLPRSRFQLTQRLINGGILVCWDKIKKGQVTSTQALCYINPGANLKSISHRCYLFEVAFVWELAKETIYLPLGCLQGDTRHN